MMSLKVTISFVLLILSLAVALPGPVPIAFPEALPAALPEAAPVAVPEAKE